VEIAQAAEADQQFLARRQISKWQPGQAEDLTIEQAKERCLETLTLRHELVRCLRHSDDAAVLPVLAGGGHRAGATAAGEVGRFGPAADPIDPRTTGSNL